MDGVGETDGCAGEVGRGEQDVPDPGRRQRGKGGKGPLRQVVVVVPRLPLLLLLLVQACLDCFVVRKGIGVERA